MKLRPLLFSLGLLIAGTVGAYLFLTHGRIVSTDNAYLKFDRVTVSAEVEGTITSVVVRENQKVQKGDPLATLDDATYKVALHKATAKLKQAESNIRSLQANYRTKQSELELAANNSRFAEKALQRELDLSKKKLTSEALLDDRQHDLDVAREQTKILESELAQLLANLDGEVDAPVESYSEVMVAQADLNLARIHLAHTKIAAPFDGVVSHLPKLGQHVNIGNPLLSLISDENVWIEANFKETEVVGLHVDQPVEIAIDAYPSHRWEGRVESLSPATGAEYSILPPQNATGNWIKVVQRIPIRIRMDIKESDPVLRAGMSVTVEIDTQSPML